MKIKHSFGLWLSTLLAFGWVLLVLWARYYIHANFQIPIVLADLTEVFIGVAGFILIFRYLIWE
jgi:hypothetical protein